MKDKVKISQWMKLDVVFNILMGLMITTELFALGTLSYLGTFSRYISDDYCEAVITRGGSVFPVVFDIYLEGIFRGTNRYTKFLFLGLAEKLGNYNMQILPALMILVWLVGLIWLVNQFRKLAGIRLPFILVCLAAVSVVFFSAWQAPNLFQTFLWRSGMVTHFAPLVFMPLLGGFVLRQINAAKKPTLWISLFVFLASFLVGGFSEPPAAFMVVIIIISIMIIWRRVDVSIRRTAINLLSYSLAGTLLALITMFIAPGNQSYGTSSFANLIIALGETFKFTVEFQVDTIKTLPLPSMISILIPFLVYFGLCINSENQPVASQRKRQLWLWVMLVPLIQYLLIAASFAPSAYGQSYPAERARFLGRFIMTTALMFEGALLGVLCAQGKLIFSKRRFIFILTNLILLTLAFYPLRAGLTFLAEVPQYRQWASTWDMREAEINRSIEIGEQDLVVRLLPSRDSVKEIDGDARHWVNRCVARYYEVDSIRSIPMSNE